MYLIDSKPTPDDLRTALPGATLAEPLALLGETTEEIEPLLAPRLDELIR